MPSAIRDGDRKFRVFKSGPRSKNYSVELFFPGAVTERVESEFGEVKQASAWASGQWAKRARVLGVARKPTRRKGFLPLPTKTLLSLPESEYRSEMNRVRQSLESPLQRRLRAIVDVAAAIDGLPSADVNWVFDTVGKAVVHAATAEAPALESVPLGEEFQVEPGVGRKARS